MFAPISSLFHPPTFCFMKKITIFAVISAAFIFLSLGASASSWHSLDIPISSLFNDETIVYSFTSTDPGQSINVSAVSSDLSTSWYTSTTMNANPISSYTMFLPTINVEPGGPYMYLNGEYKLDLVSDPRYSYSPVKIANTFLGQTQYNSYTFDGYFEWHFPTALNSELEVVCLHPDFSFESLDTYDITLDFQRSSYRFWAYNSFIYDGIGTDSNVLFYASSTPLSIASMQDYASLATPLRYSSNNYPDDFPYSWKLPLSDVQSDIFIYLFLVHDNPRPTNVGAFVFHPHDIVEHSFFMISTEDETPTFSSVGDLVDITSYVNNLAPLTDLTLPARVTDPLISAIPGLRSVIVIVWVTAVVIFIVKKVASP